MNTQVRVTLVTFALLILCLNPVKAFATEGHHTLGIQGGEEMLTSDVGGNFSNALGFGAFFDYAASDYLEFELSWINSSHPLTNSTLNINGVSVPVSSFSLVDNSFMLALQYDIDTYDIFTPYLKGGAEFTSASMNIPSSGTLSSTAFGLDIGFGARADLGSNFMAGLDLLYHSMFTGTATLAGSSTAVNVVESYYTVMLRLGYAFGEGGYHTKPLSKAGAP